MINYRPLRYKLPIKELGFTFFSHHSAAILLKKRFSRTLSEQFSPAKAIFKYGLTGKNASAVNLMIFVISTSGKELVQQNSEWEPPYLLLHTNEKDELFVAAVARPETSQIVGTGEDALFSNDSILPVILFFILFFSAISTSDKKSVKLTALGFIL